MEQRHHCNKHVNHDVRNKTCKIWYGTPPPLGQLHPFAPVGYMRSTTTDNELKVRGEKCTMLVISPINPTGTFKVLNIRTWQSLDRQNVSWYLESTKKWPSGEQALQSASIRAAEVIQTIEDVDGYGGGRREASDEQADQGEQTYSKNRESAAEEEDLESPSENAEIAGELRTTRPGVLAKKGAKAAPAALRRIADHWPGSEPTIFSTRTRSGRGDGGDESGEPALSVILASDMELEFHTTIAPAG